MKQLCLRACMCNLCKMKSEGALTKVPALCFERFMKWSLYDV